MIKYKNQRVGIFIDVANMYHTAQSLFKTNVNFKEVMEEAVAGRQLIRAITYVVKSSSSEEEGFFEALHKQGFEVKMKELQVFPGGVKKADWDVGLAVDAITLADRLDSIIIVSGDGDYVPLVRYLKENKGCLVEIVAFAKTTSQRLIGEADAFFDLGSNLKQFLMPKKKKKEEKVKEKIDKAI